MSRKMKPEEEDAFEAKRGFKPTRFDVALDCLAVYVNKDNPVKGFTLAQLDSIFSKTRKSGYADIATWGQAGLTDAVLGRSAHQPLRPQLGQRHLWLFQGACPAQGRLQGHGEGAARLGGRGQGVAKDRQGIGYSGIGYRTSEVRAVPLAKTENDKLVEPTFENAINGHLSAGPHAVHLRGQEAGRAAAAAGQGVPQVRPLEAGPGDRRNKDGYGQLPDKMIEKNVKQLD